MTREEVLEQMQADLKVMSEKDKKTVLFSEDGVDWTPVLLAKEVENDTEFGREYVKLWSDRQNLLKLRDEILNFLVSAMGTSDDRCDDPNCQKCHPVLN